MSWPRERLARFLTFISERPPGLCWPWQGSLTPKGIGRYRYRDRRRIVSVYAARVMWAIHHGRLVPARREVIHRCTDLSCCNPAHLVLGSPALRCALLPERGRSIAGTRHPAARLSPRAIERMLRLKRRKPELTGRELAVRFGLRSTAWVNAILRGQGWRVVRMPRLGPQPKGPRLRF
jgi:HNH endonuclease